MSVAAPRSPRPTSAPLAGGRFRHQLPVFSPLPLGAAVASVAAPLLRDARPALAASLATEFDAEAVVLCGSGTQALRLALEVALRCAGPGPQRVALPAYSCFDVAAAAVATGAELLLYDVEPGTLAPESASLERALHAGARVVIAAPLYGLPLEWRALRERCDTAGALLIEDAAQGFGARWEGRPLGSFGDVSVLSFGRGKGWTGGRGGALLLRGTAADARAAARAASLVDDLSTALVSTVQAALGRPSVFWLPVAIPWLRLGETVYHDAAPPAALPRSAAALLHRTRPLAEREVAARRAGARALLAGIRARAGLQPVHVEPGAEPGFLRLPVRLAGGMSDFSDPRAAMRLGVMPGYPATLGDLPAVSAQLVDRPAGGWPGAAELVRTLITLPTHSRVSDAERKQVLRMLDSVG